MMTVIIETPGGFHAEAIASGKYNPDILHDLANEARDMLAAAHTSYAAMGAALGVVEPSTGPESDTP